MKIETKTEYAGTGAAVQAVGLIACFFVFPVGLLAGIMLIIIGARMSKKFLCGNCGNPVDSKSVRICPTCHAAVE